MQKNAWNDSMSIKKKIKWEEAIFYIIEKLCILKPGVLDALNYN